METHTSTVRRRRRASTAAAVAAGLVLLAAAGAVAFALAGRGTLPANVRVAGVDVGSLSVDDAHALVLEEAGRRLDRRIELAAPGLVLQTSGRELGAVPDVEAALERADDVGTLERLGARIGLGDERAIPLRYRIDPARFEALFDRLAARIDSEPRAAQLRVRGRAAAVVPAEQGRAVDRTALARVLAGLPRATGVPVVALDPEVTTAAAERARSTVEKLLAEPRVVRAGDSRAVIRPLAIRRALRIQALPGRLAVSLDPRVLARALGPRLRRLERPPRAAAFVTNGTRVRVRPSRPGRELDIERFARSLAKDPDSVVHRARFVRVEPSFTTAEAEKLGIRERISEFTTYYTCCQPRVTNIQRAAELLDGTIVRPGETFSMNDVLGERTEERGFVAAPQIFNGRLEDAVGGGISQIATTLYNAAFFAGVKLVAHQAHQFYISRYPMGREATVSWGGPELVFRNDWRAAILMRVSAGDTSISVRFYSARLGRRVETETLEPYAYRSPATIRVTNPSLPPGATSVVQSAGASGFTVEYTRRVFRFDRLLREERYTVRYDPQNAVVEVGPPKKPKPKPPKAGAGGDPSGQGPAEDAGAREASAERVPAG